MIHPTAIVSPLAKLGSNVRIGPYCIIGANVEIGDDCVLHSHVVIEGYSKIGCGNEFFPFVVIGGKTQDLKYQGEPTYVEIGDRNVFRENCTVHRGTHAELAAALSPAGQGGPRDGNLYFSGATAALFPAVVQATRDGTAVALGQGSPEPDSARAAAAPKPTAPATEDPQ